MIRLIENLCAINGVSGDEQDVAAAIIEQIKDYCEYEVTPLGDVIAFKKGAKHPRNRVMFDAHMDEVGFIITYITEEGFLRFATVGGIDNRVIQGKPVVVGKNKVYGIISSKPIHLIDRDHRMTPSKRRIFRSTSAAGTGKKRKVWSAWEIGYPLTLRLYALATDF